MDEPAGTTARLRELLLVSVTGIALSIVMTWPLVTGMGRLGRTIGADGQYGIWNVAWVARTLVVDPFHLYDANIFYPHRRTLAYSEVNLLEGAIAIPVYWITRNPHTAHNLCTLFALASAFVCAYLLMRYLTRDAWASAVAAILYACCPYRTSHSSHIQLLMTGGIPLAMLMFHHMADAPSVRRGVWLGVALVAQALSCAYYGIFTGLMVGYGALVIAASRRLWQSRHYWTALAAGALTSVVCVVPFFLPFLRVQEETGFRRPLEEADRWAANLQSYIVSPAHAHRWLLHIALRFERYTEPLFPGLLAVGFGIAGVAIAVRQSVQGDRARRETLILYGSLGLLAFWASFGPHAGLYRLLSNAPVFSFLRAPARFGVVVVLTLAVFAAIAISRFLAALPAHARSVAAAALAAAAIAELNVLPFPWERAHPIPASYSVLAKLPRGPVAEFPFYGERMTFPLHAQYLVFSTAHWMPLVNGYSDVIPRDFREAAPRLSSFPSTDAFAVLARRHVRYITIHWDQYAGRAAEIRSRLEPFARHLRELASDPQMTLYEVVSYP